MRVQVKLRKNQSSFPLEILQQKNILFLEIHSENLTTLPSELQVLRELKGLELYLPGLESLDEWIWQFPKLEILKIKKTTLKILPPLTQMTTIKTLGLGHNQLTQLPGPTSYLQALEMLEACHNKIEKLPDHFERMENLKRLSLDGNQLMQVPKELAQLPKLAHLSLDQNPLTEDARQFLFERFKVWFHN